MKDKNRQVGRRELSPELRRRLRERKDELGLTNPELKQKSGVSISSIKNALSSGDKTIHQREATVAKIERALGLRENVKQSQISFQQLVKRTSKIDAELIRLVRQWETPDLDGYKHLASGAMRENDLEIGSLHQMFTDALSPTLLSQSAKAADIDVVVDKDFKKLTFAYNNRTEVVKSPELLWDCHCKTPDSVFGPQDCPIHKLREQGNLIEARFFGGNVRIHYDGIEVMYKDGPELWPPSVDAFALAKNMRSTGVFETRIESVLDLGSGTGFLGILAAISSTTIREVTFSDWLYTPVAYSIANWGLNNGDKSHVQATGRVGMHLEWLEGGFKRFDLAICNPPYLPILRGFENLSISSTVAGTDLLQTVIRENKRLAKTTIVSFSNIALPEAIQAAQASGAKLVPIGNPARAPFRVPQAFAESGYLDALVKERKLDYDPDRRHPHEHTITTYKLC